MAETYDPKAKKMLDSVTIKGVEIKVKDRVRYVGSSPCFTGKCGVLTKLKREWVSARQMARAGFAGSPAGYATTAYVLWDGTPTTGPYAFPQSCCPDELEPAS